MNNQNQEILQSAQSKQASHIAPHIPNPLKGKAITFENDFGKKPLGLGHLTKDQGIIVVLSAAAAFIGGATPAGLPLVGLIVAAAINDIKYAGLNNAADEKAAPKQETQSEQETIEVPARAVVEDEPQLLAQRTEQVSTQVQPVHPPLKKTGVTLREDPGFSLIVIRNLARSPLSKIFGAVPGSGKTTTQRALIKEVATQFPLAQFYLTQTKRDPFLGIESIPSAVAFSAPRRDDGKPILNQADRVSRILEYRSGFPANEARELFKNKPVILLLCDYSDSIKQCSSEVKNELTKIVQQIRFNGRALNVQVWLDVQVLNQLEALGLTGSDSRSSGIILTLGAERIEEGGDFGVIDNAIFGSSETFSSGFKTKLKPHLEAFKVRSRQTNRTLVVTPFMDANAFLLPDWRNLENDQLPDATLLQIERNIQQQETELKEAKISVHAPSQQQVDNTLEVFAASELSEPFAPDLGEPLKTILLFCKERADWVKVRDIQRKDFPILQGKNSDDIRRYLGLLNDLGYGEIEESGTTVRFKAS